MQTKSIKNNNEKSNFKDPAFPNDPTKVMEVNIYEVETTSTVKVNKIQLEQKKAELESELLEINNFLAQIKKIGE